jgi:ferric-dicitrate binding protein FerR (iron transport regulator)
MKTKSPYGMALACLAACSIAIPMESWGAPPTADPRAGEVSRVIPMVNIARGAKSIKAEAKTVVDWQDTVNTQANARARVALDDGSVLNVGSESSVKVAKHDAGAQQTDLEVGFGKMRSQAQKISKPGGKFEVHTSAGVAGVVGTDFYVSYENNVMTVIVFEGLVKVCNLAGICVEVKPGQTTTVRNGDSSGPAAPTQAALSTLTEAVTATNLEGSPSGTSAHHLGKGTGITIAILAAIPAIIVPIVLTRGTTASPPAPSQQCGNLASVCK